MDHPQPERGMLLPTDLLDHIRVRSKNGARIVRALPRGGRIMIDRPLPFICVFRTNENTPEEGVDSIVRAQTAYLRFTNDPAATAELRALLTTIATSVARTTQAFLVLELWPADPEKNKGTFKVIGPLNNAPETAEALEKGLEGITARWRGTRVRMIDSDMRRPGGMPELLDLGRMKKEGVVLFGIEVPQIYRSAEGQLSKIALQRLRVRFTEVVKRTVHAFARVQTPQRSSHYLMFGRTRFTRLAYNIDRALARISGSFDLLLNVTPVNTEEAWHEFQRSGHQQRPDLHYRLISVDPEKMKRDLYALRIDDMEDTTLQAIFRSKRSELDTQATLLSERGRREFLYSGLRLYGGVDEAILGKAHEIMRMADRPSPSKRMDAEAFARAAGEELEYYRSHFEGLDMKVEVRDDIAGVMVSKATVLIGGTFSADERHAVSLLHHEVGTHVLTYANGWRQPFHQMYAGMAGYEELQEGLAVLAEHLTGGLVPSRMRTLAGRVIAVHALIQGAEFVECFDLLHREHGLAPRQAFNITVRVYRGGGFPKDAIYLKGLDRLIDHLDGSAEKLHLFYLGKFALPHLPLVLDLHHRGVLKEPVVPRFLNEEARTRVERLKKGMELVSIIDQ